MKSLLEGMPTTQRTVEHLDRCLTCRACETTCPSGVQYARLIDYVRPRLDAVARRAWHTRLARWLVRTLVPSPVFGRLLTVGRALRAALPRSVAALIPSARAPGVWPPARHATRWLAFGGCVQEVVRPSINAAAARVFDRAGLSLVALPATQCCGALAYHLGAHAEARARARRNIEIWEPALASGVAGIFCASSGCSTMLKDYGRLLADDPAYARRAQRVAASVRDSTELATALELDGVAGPRVSVQTPCSVTHGLGGEGRIEAALSRMGCEPYTPEEAHLCCGSAGSYSLLQPKLAATLRARKLAHLAAGEPAVIATANIGCLLHLETVSSVPVRHWLEIVDGLQAAAESAPDCGGEDGTVGADAKARTPAVGGRSQSSAVPIQ